MKKGRILHVIIMALLYCALALMLAACGGSADSPAAGSGAGGDENTLTVVIANDISNLDPHDNVEFAHHKVTRQIFETLVVRDEQGELIPWLCESWEYLDDVTINFKLREGVYFHNGDELKASDVLFSFRRAVEENTTAAIQVNRIDFDKSSALDDYTVQIVTDGPYAMQIAMLENPLACIISERAYTESNGDFFEAPIGTGPYKFVEYRTGDSVRLTANENYWRPGEPQIEQIVVRIIVDSSSRAIEAESGGTDIVYDIMANDIDRVGANPNVNLLTAMGTNTSYVFTNVQKAPLDDIRVREAIWLGIDVASAIDIAYGNYGAVGTGIVSPGIEGRHPDLSPYFPSRDVERARALLAEAGYAEGLTLSISCENANQQRMDFCEALQAQLAEVGITLELDFMEMNAWVAKLLAGEAELALYGFTASSGEAGRILMRWLPEQTESHISGWYDDTYIAIVEQALQTIDNEARYALFHEAQELLMEAMVVLPVWHKEINAAIRPRVQGLTLTPTYEQPYLQFVYFE